MGLEEMLLEWITLQRSKNLRVSRKLIQRKARTFVEEKAASQGQLNDLRTSKAWLGEFMPENGLLLRHRTTQAQKTPE